MRQLAGGAAAVLVACLLLAGCSAGDRPADELQVGGRLTAAEPARSPEPARVPDGRLLRTPGPATASTIEPATRTLAVAIREPSAVALYDLDDLRAAPRLVRLPGQVRHLGSAPGKVLAPVPGEGAVFTIDVAGGKASRTAVPGRPSSAAMLGDRMLVGLPERQTLAVLRDGRTVGEITGDVHPGQVLVSGGHAMVLDRLRSAVFDVRLDEQSFGAGLRADQGAVNAVVDDYGRLLVSETRVGQLFAFGTDPVLMRQRYPVPGGPYGIAYDGSRDMAWVTLTKRNEVVGYDVAGGEPVERKRFATVRQPDSVSVDPQRGRVLIPSAARDEMQVIDL